jgi:SAM-dependent methyltransferase
MIRSLRFVCLLIFTASLLADCGSPSQDYRASHADHRFEDAEHWARVFESPERDEWQRPDAVLALMRLRPDEVVADIGAGTGYFPVRFARAVPRGRVYGIDVEPDMVRYLAERAEREGLGNLHAIECAPDDPRIPEPVDVIFLCNTYHHIHNRTAYFARLKERLNPGGRVVIVDFKPGRLPVGPPPDHKVAVEKIDEEMRAAGYRLLLRDDDLPYQHVLIFSP